jgi:hypothetical protein
MTKSARPCRGESASQARVLVEDNDRVKKGDVLVELDLEPYRASEFHAPVFRGLHSCADYANVTD